MNKYLSRSFPRVFSISVLLTVLLAQGSPIYSESKPLADFSQSIHESLQAKKILAETVRDQGPKIWAVYLPWYGTGRNGWTHWKGWGHKPKNIFDDNIAAVHHPLTGLYNSSSKKLIQYHIRLAKAAGIDGFIVDWYAEREWHDSNISKILKEAEKEQFTIALLYEARLAEQNRNVMKKHFKMILDKYANSKVYQKVSGVPVIYIFGMISTGFTAEDFSQVQTELIEEGRKTGKNYVFSLVGDSTLKTEYFKAANGLFEWINMGAFEYDQSWRKNPEVWEHHARKEAYKISAKRPDIFVIGSIYAGFDDEALGGGNWGEGSRRVLDDQGGKVIQKTIDYTIQQKLPWAIIQTFNDWNEGTEFEPSLEKGFGRMWGILKLSAGMKGKVLDPRRVVKLVEKFYSRQSAYVFDRRRKEVFKNAWDQTKGISEELETEAEKWAVIEGIIQNVKFTMQNLKIKASNSVHF